jgi:hypothetical protein
MYQYTNKSLLQLFVVSTCKLIGRALVLKKKPVIMPIIFSAVFWCPTYCNFAFCHLNVIYFLAICLLRTKIP